MTNTINSQLAAVTPQKQKQGNTVGEQPKEKQQANLKVEDTVTLSQQTDVNETYSTTLSPDDLAQKSYDMLRRLVTSMLEQQGIDFKISVGDETVDLQEITQEEAQELISDDGYFGVEQTSDRIVDFAIAAAGGDISKLDAIKEGVDKGFNEAKEIFGGWLPDISYDTYDAVMEKLDTWAAESEG